MEKKPSARLALRKAPQASRSATDTLVREIQDSWMAYSELTPEERNDLLDSFGVDVGHPLEENLGIARLVLRTGDTLVVCGVEKVSEDWIRCHVVNKPFPHALIRTDDVARVTGNLFG